MSLKVLASLMLCAAFPLFAAECGTGLGGHHRQFARGDGLEIAFTTTPWPLQVGQHFRLDFAVCTADGTGIPATIRVDAEMPAHKHGMNYRPTVMSSGKAGRYAAQGLMFHMPGRWRFIFDVDVNGRSQRLTKDLEVE